MSPDNHGKQSWLCSHTGIATLVALSVLGFLIYEGHGNEPHYHGSVQE